MYIHIYIYIYILYYVLYVKNHFKALHHHAKGIALFIKKAKETNN